MATLVLSLLVSGFVATASFAAPNITAMSQAGGMTAGGDPVRIDGTGFLGVTSVTFDGLPVASFSVDSDTQITLVTASHAAGDVVVEVNDGVNSATAPQLFRYLDPPTISSVTPASGPMAGGTAVSIVGTNLDLIKFVLIDGATVSYTDPGSTTQVIATTAAHAAGAVDMTIETFGGSVTLTNGFTYVTTVPDAPTTVSATAGDRAATVGFSAPPNDGGSPITGYTVTSSPGNFTATSGASPITVTGLTNGTSYTFTVVATNGVGDSAASTPSNAVTPLSGDATLSGLVLSNGTLTPPFSAGTTSYTAVVGNSVSALTVTPTVHEPNATITVNGAAATSGAAAAVALAVGQNPISIVVTAQDGTTMTYTVTVTRAPASASADASLSGLALSAGTLTPGFATGTTSYTATVLYGVTSITVTPTTTSATATVTVNGFAVASGSASAPVPLSVGTNAISVQVTAEDGTSITNYAVSVNRGASADADLASLVLNQGTLSPAFSAGTTSYSVAVPYSMTSIMMTPTTSDPIATMTVDGAGATSGSSSTTTLSVGANSVPIVVTAQDGTTKTYTVTITRAAPSAVVTLSDLVLSQGTLSPVFASATTGYTASVPFAVTSIAVTPTASDAGATITVNSSSVISGNSSGSIALAVGINTVSVVVTAEDGTSTLTYRVDVTREPAATDSSLSNLVLSVGTLSPVFASGTTSYTASVASTVSSITVTPTASDANSTIAVNSFNVASGTPSGAIALAPGPNTITTVVTAQNGSTQSYSVIVTRMGASADLASLVPSAGTLAPSFNAATTSYTAVVANTVTSITLRPTADDPLATIAVQGTGVASGSDSGPLPLNVGANTISTLVTAQNGSTKTYTLTVTRASATASNDASLAGLISSEGPLSPAFASATTSYSQSVLNGVATLTVQPTASQAGATITVNGISIASGATTSPIALAVGANTINTRVTAEDGASVQVYSLVVTRAAPVVPNDASLSNLQLDTGTLSPLFTSGSLAYEATVPYGTAAVVATPTATQVGATITVNGVAVASGSAAAPTALTPQGGLITIVVTAPDGTTTSSYSVTILPSLDTAKVAVEVDKLVRGYVATRQSLLATSVDTPSLLERRATGGGPGTVSVVPNGNDVTMRFASSYAQLSAWNAAGEAAEYLAAANPETLKFNFWIDGTTTLHMRTDDGTDHWGSLGLVSVGSDYLVNDGLLVGLAAHGDFMDDETLDSDVSGKGMLVGPYISAELHDGLFFDAALYGGRSWNEVTSGLFSGTFETERVLAQAQLKGVWALSDAVTLKPDVSAFYLRETVDDYQVANADGVNVDIAGFTSEQLRLSAGARLEYGLTAGDDLDLLTFLAGAFGLVSQDGSDLWERTFGTIEAGFQLSSAGPWSVGSSVKASIDSSGLQSVSGKANVTVNF